MSREILLGIDMGTTSLRVGFYDRYGKNLGFSVQSYELKKPRYAWAEQSPADWLEALEQAVRKGMRENHITKEQILALSTGTTCCSVVLCKRDGTPIRDCIMWMDVRANQESEEIAALTNEKLSAEWMPCKLKWLKKYEPDHYEMADIFCECQDWITYQLTGIWSVNINTACNWGYNSQEQGFPTWFYEKIGLKDALDKFPSKQCYAVGDKIGTLTPAMAKRLGLCEDTIVAQGGVDSSIGILGMGVAKPGKVALMTGSSNLAMLLTKQMMFGDSTINAGPDHLLKGWYTSFRGQVSSNSIIEWFRKEFCKDIKEEEFFDRMEKEAVNVPAGSEGLLVLDYWQGNRHPYFDTSVRGLMYGLSLNHTRAHMYRALMEGISYGTNNLLEQFRQHGFEVNEINISGGTTNSRLFMQILADISNVSINVPNDCQAVCMGAAICSAVASGIYCDLETAVNYMVSMKETIVPDQEHHKIYREMFLQYQSLYPILKDWMHKTTEICFQPT